MTNADKIRSMTDEELAELLDRAENAGYNDESITPRENGNYMDMIDWLRMEVEE